MYNLVGLGEKILNLAQKCEEAAVEKAKQRHIAVSASTFICLYID
jgi:hypothetical protein